MPIISIIIPTFNNEQTISRCLDSVITQTMRDIEIIVINDGSTDATGKIVEQYIEKDNRIILINKENSGQGLARNCGIAISCGEYLGFVDADDTIEKNMYELLLEKIQKYDCDVAQCDIKNIYKDNSYHIQLHLSNLVVNIRNKERAKYFSDYIFTSKHSYECCNKLIRREFLEENNIEFLSNSLVYSEDLMFNLDIALRLNKIVFLKNTLYNYYQYDQSHSKKNHLSKLERLCALFDIFSQHTKSVSMYKRLKYVIARLAVLILMINLAHMLDFENSDAVIKNILSRSDVKKYLGRAIVKNPKFRHKLISFLLLYMPFKLKKLVLKHYYTRWN